MSSLNPPPMKPPPSYAPMWLAQLARSVYQMFELLSRIRAGSGSPEGVVSAPVGHLFLRTDGGSSTTLYVKESGSSNTGWSAK